MLTYADVCRRMQVLGHTGEVTRHGLLYAASSMLLKLAAMFPGLYAKVMASPKP